MDDLLFSYADPATPLLKRKVINLIERSTGQPRLKRLYLQHKEGAPAGEDFFAAAVRQLSLNVLFDQARLAAIPKDGPVVIVSNHPYGVLDGLVLSALVGKARPDFLVLTNAVLLRAPEARPHLLAVDFSETPEAMETNLASREAARKHLAKGGCLVVFPAGGVSTAPDKWGRKPAIDAPWQPFTSQLIQRAKATVVPVFFHGQNSRLFQIASHLSLTLRLSLIFKEVRDRIGTDMAISFGDPIPFERLAHLKDRKEMANELMRLTYSLQPPSEPKRSLRVRLKERVARRLSAA